MGWICDLLTHSAQLLLTLKRDPRKEQCSLREEDTEPQTWTESQTWTNRITWSFVRFYLLVRTCIETVNTDDFSIFVHLENTGAPSSSRGASVPETFEKCACMILIPSWSHEDIKDIGSVLSRWMLGCIPFATHTASRPSHHATCCWLAHDAVSV
jgi:hypothetical protein